MKQAIKLILFFVLAIWAIHFASFLFPVHQYGLIPRRIESLPGIFFSPFLHGSVSHLLSNTFSFAIFAFIMAVLEGQRMLRKVILMILIGGLLTWAFARDGNHIGASGLIFSLWGYLLLAGWFSGKMKYVLVSILIIFFYSGMIFGVFPGQASISWESHLFGFIAGIIVARIYH